MFQWNYVWITKFGFHTLFIWFRFFFNTFSNHFFKCENNSQFMSHTETGCGLHMGCTGRGFATSGLNKCKHLVRKAVHTWASKDNDLLCFHVFFTFIFVSQFSWTYPPVDLHSGTEVSPGNCSLPVIHFFLVMHVLVTVAAF